MTSTYEGIEVLYSNSHILTGKCKKKSATSRMSNYSLFLRFISPKGGVVLGKGVISTDEMNAAANRVTCWQVQFVNARMALVEVICIYMYFYHRQEVQYRCNYVLKIIIGTIFMYVFS